MFTQTHRLAIAWLTVVAAVLSQAPQAAEAQSAGAVTAGALRAYSTIHSIGVEWDVVGDSDHDAAVAVEYRFGAESWKAALPLVRVDYNGRNLFAGSLLFLAPGTLYEVRLSLADPDGGAASQLLNVTTRRLPRPPDTGSVYHVVPGSGGGDGSPGNPFLGVAAAQERALPGDTFLLHAGSYGRVLFDLGGSGGNYIAWKAAGDGEVAIAGIEAAASHLWLEGLTVRNQANGLVSVNAPENVVVKGCRFLGNHYGIYLQRGGTYWYIADNTVVGDTPAASESFDGEGIELNTTSGHTVAHNSITNVADGISYPHTNVDIFGNDIFDTSDDGIEGDYGWNNIRMWGNRIHNAVHNGISFQPQYGGPWYILRNQIVSSKEAPLKFRTTDRFVLVHNTIVNWADIICCNPSHLFGAVSRNNLWISAQGGKIWWFGSAAADWRTDLDFDGFDWGAGPPFSYAGVTYPDLSSFASASALERNGRQVSKQIFSTFEFPAPSPAPVPAQVMALRPATVAVDAGTPLPNVSERFTGAAPDLGAFEYGLPVPAFGPRPSPTASLAASPSYVQPGEASVLSWTTAEASEVTISPGIGAVDPGTGSVTVVPPSTTRYTLTAEGPGGTVTASCLVTVGTTEPAVPSAPSALSASPVSTTEIALAWSDNASGETGYRVEFSTDGAAFTSVATLAANAAAYTSTGLSAGRTYYFRVSAFNETGSSLYSNTASATTPPVALPPAAPSALVAAPVSTDRVNLSWNDNSVNESGFVIERRENKTWRELALVGAGVTTYSDGTVRAGRSYAYRVRAHHVAASSAYSNVATVSVPRR